MTPTGTPQDSTTSAQPPRRRRPVQGLAALAALAALLAAAAALLGPAAQAAVADRHHARTQQAAAKTGGGAAPAAVPDLGRAGVPDASSAALVRSTGGRGHAAAAAPDASTAPPPVSSLKVSSTTASTVELSWSPPSGGTAAGVLIRRGLAGAPPASPGSGSFVARLGPAARSYTDADLSPGTRFSYAVFSYDAAGYSAAASVTATTRSGHSTTVNACANGDAVTTNTTWSPAKASTYQVYCTLTVEAGVTLTIKPGSVVKLSGEIVVASKAALHAGAAKAAPVIFTSYRDSEVGGPVTGQPPPQYNDYPAGVVLQEHTAATITNAVFQYGFDSVTDAGANGCGTAGAVHLTVTGSVLESPMDLGQCPSQGSARFTVTNDVVEVPGTVAAAVTYDPASVDRITMTGDWFDYYGTTGPQHAIWDAGLPSGIDVSGDAKSNTYTPGSGSVLVGFEGTIPAGSAWHVALPPGVALVGTAPVNPVLEAAGTITIAAGTQVGDPSWGPTTLAVAGAGRLSIDGTAAAPVAMAGDTEVLVEGSGTADVTHAVFTGTLSASANGDDIVEGDCQSGTENVDVSGSTLDAGVALGVCAAQNSETIQITGNRFARPTGATFIDLANRAAPDSPGTLTIAANTFSPNGGTMTGTPLPAITTDGWPDQGIDLAGPQANVFTGSGPDRVVQVSDSFVPANQTWQVSPAGHDVLLLLDTIYQGGPAVTISGTLRIDQGSIVKAEGSQRSTAPVSGTGLDVVSGGSLDVAGTAAAPVTFTSFKDNTVGGDSTGDPSSTGTPAGHGGDYGTSIATSEDTTISITHAIFRDGLFAVEPSGVEPAAAVRSITISHSQFATELALGDYAQVESGYAVTLTDNTWHFDGAPSGQFSLGGPYDPSALQPAVLLYNVDPAGVCLDGSCASKFTGSGAGRVVALLGTVIPTGQAWTVDPSTGAVLVPVTDTDYLPNPGLDVAGSLTLMPGTAVKSATQAPGIEVASTGTLSASGVIFTSVSDSSVGGDSAGDGGLSKPSIGDYGAGGAIRYDDVPRADISAATFKYAGIAVDSPDGGSVTVSGDTFTMNATAVSDTLGLGTSAAVDNSSFAGNQVAIDASSIWEPFSAGPVSCQFLASVSTGKNQYGTPDSSTKPLVTPGDYASIKAAMAVKGTTDDPDGWTKLIRASRSDVVEGWGVEPCAAPDDNHAVVAIPMTFDGS